MSQLELFTADLGDLDEVQVAARKAGRRGKQAGYSCWQRWTVSRKARDPEPV